MEVVDRSNAATVRFNSKPTDLNHLLLFAVTKSLPFSSFVVTSSFLNIKKQKGVMFNYTNLEGAIQVHIDKPVNI